MMAGMYSANGENQRMNYDLNKKVQGKYISWAVGSMKLIIE
jgi:hypothetical protein